MKKILFLVSLIISLASFQSYAAPLSWTSTPSNGVAGVNNPEELFGNYNDSLSPNPGFPEDGDNWVFTLDAAERVDIDVIEFLDRELNVQVTLNGNLLDFTAPTWTFSGFLAAGDHTLNIKGDVLRQAEIDIQVLGIDTAVPVPGAVWLFGSAIVGLMGFANRRKLAA